MITKESEVLDAAADLIMKDGWFKSVGDEIYRYPKIKSGKVNHVCTITAIGVVTEWCNYNIRIAAIDALDESIPSMGGNDEIYNIIKWNDTRKSKDAVIRRLRMVARQLREKGH